MDCKFVVGQKVVYVKHFDEETYDIARKTGADVPVINKIYTINAINPGTGGVHMGHIYLSLAEIGKNPFASYNHLNFKPLDQIRTEMFSKFLNNVKVPENV
jgi:hypothetical protein